jgi:hypothetical protein
MAGLRWPAPQRRDARPSIYDLLASAGFPPLHAHARQGIEAYHEAVPGFPAAGETDRGRMRPVESLIRALGLAARINQRDLRDLVVRDILAWLTPCSAPARYRTGWFTSC